MKKLIFLNPRGPCAGVDRALEILEKVLEKYGAPVYVNHEIVHNEFVVKNFENKGVIFNIRPQDVPKNSVYVFSAHGIAPQVRKQAKKNNLTVIDATCPLVEKVHQEAKNFSKIDPLGKPTKHILYIGHKNHPEAEGVMGIAQMTLVDSVQTAQNLQIQNTENLTLLTQTTLSIDETSEIISVLEQKFPTLVVPKVKDICYATQNRQEAVKNILDQVDFVLVVGSPQSSNSVRLVETALKKNTPAQLVSSTADIPFDILSQKKVVAITSGASVPEELFITIVHSLQKKISDLEIQNQLGRKENVVFQMPSI